MAQSTAMSFYEVEQFVTDQLVFALEFQEHPAYAMLSCRLAIECIIKYQYEIENRKTIGTAGEHESIISIMNKCRELRPQIKEVIESINAQTRGNLHFNRDRLGENSPKSEDIMPIVAMVKQVFRDIFQKNVETGGVFEENEQSLSRIRKTIVDSIEENSTELNYNQLLLSAVRFAQERGADFSEYEMILSNIDHSVKHLQKQKIVSIEREIQKLSHQNEIVLKLLTTNNSAIESNADDNEIEKMFRMLDNQRVPDFEASSTSVMMSGTDEDLGIYIRPTGKAAEPLLIHLGLLNCIRNSNDKELIRMALSYKMISQQFVGCKQISQQQSRNLQTLLIWHLILDDMDLSMQMLNSLPKQSILNLCVLFLLPSFEDKEQNINQLNELLIKATQGWI